jgi:peptide/nickel transport system substrate-binding protein
VALDRTSIIRSVLDTLGTAMASPFLSSHRVPGAALLPYDMSRAAALLDSAGWRDTDNDGVRDKGGRPLAVRLSAPSSSQPRIRAALQIQDAWKSLGVAVTYNELQNPAMVADNEAGQFDASIMGYSGAMSPSGLLQSFRTDPTFGRNWGGYSNPEFDAALDRASQSLGASDAMTEYSRAGSILADDAPGIWLYELRAISGIHGRFRPAAMRPDAWWAHLADWTVNPGQLKPRDRVGVR